MDSISNTKIGEKKAFNSDLICTYFQSRVTELAKEPVRECYVFKVSSKSRVMNI